MVGKICKQQRPVLILLRDENHIKHPLPGASMHCLRVCNYASGLWAKLTGQKSQTGQKCDTDSLHSVVAGDSAEEESHREDLRCCDRGNKLNNIIIMIVIHAM